MKRTLMRKNIFLSVLILSSVVGCASLSSVTAPNRAHLLKLALGMNKQEVLKIMGTRPMKVKSDPLHAVIVNNPYRSETLNDKEGKSYEILYYATDNKNEDDLIKDTDLTPLVFDSDGKLIGWGQNFLADFIAKNQVKNVNENKNAKPEKKKSNGNGFGKKKKK